MAKNKPDFSIIMANWNNAPYLKEAIESVINQTHTNWELLIIDDKSTDNSCDIIKNYLHDDRIKLLVNKQNSGYIYNLRELINLASSDLIGILDSDDALTPNAVQVMLTAYLNSDCGFAYSQFMECDQNLHPLKLGFCCATPQGKSNLHFHHMNHFKTFRKSIYLQTSGYDDEIVFAEDIDLVFKLEEISKPLFINEVLYLYRLLPLSQSHAPTKKFISGSSAKLAKYKAYNRRYTKLTLVPNVSKVKIIWEMLKGCYLSVRLKNLHKLKFFISKITEIISR